MAICASLYVAVGGLGYLHELAATPGNVLTSFSHDDAAINVGRAGLAFTLLFSFPLLVLPFCAATTRLMQVPRRPCDTSAPPSPPRRAQ